MSSSPSGLSFNTNECIALQMASEVLHEELRIGRDGFKPRLTQDQS
jgi:hypothetical protein